MTYLIMFGFYFQDHLRKQKEICLMETDWEFPFFCFTLQGKKQHKYQSRGSLKSCYKSNVSSPRRCAVILLSHLYVNANRSPKNEASFECLKQWYLLHIFQIN